MSDLVRRIDAFSPADDKTKTEEAADVLNILSSLSLSISITPVYDALVRKGILRGYGSARVGARSRHIVEQGVSKIQVGNYNDNIIHRPTLQEKQSIARELSERTGLPLRALTPSGSRSKMSESSSDSTGDNSNIRRSPNININMSANGLQILSIAICWLCVYLTRSYSITHPNGLDLTSVRNIFALFGVVVSVDQGVLNGLLFDTVYQRMNERYRERIVAHEAGHFLIAYLFGLPIHRYSLSAFDALKSRVPGQAATLFADDELSSSLRERKLGIHVVNRYSVVAMAGLASEGLLFGEATGGDADVSGLVRLLTGLEPGWKQRDIRIQARWAVVVAVGLIQTERNAYDALRKCMREGRPVGECVVAIEGAVRSEEEVEGMWREKEGRWGGRETEAEVGTVENGVGGGNASGGVTEEELDKREREVLADMRMVEERLQEGEREGEREGEGERES